jgi:hypothetical protein
LTATIPVCSILSLTPNPIYSFVAIFNYLNKISKYKRS